MFLFYFAVNAINSHVKLFSDSCKLETKENFLSDYVEVVPFLPMFVFYSRPEPEITWTKNGKPLPVSDQTRLGNNGRTLVLRQVSQEDKGSYKCQAKNTAGTETHTIEVDVKSE